MEASQFALISAGVFMLVGMLTGWWKYAHIARSADATAPAYVDICHRTALMYAFACIVLQQLAMHSRWSHTVNLLAAAIPILFFASAVATYAIHGWLNDTDNQLRQPHRLGTKTVPAAAVRAYMLLLALGEIGGLLVLIAGVVM